MYNLPVLSPSQAEIGEIMKARMAYNAAIAGGVKGKIVFGPSVTIEVTNPTGAAVTVPLTGAVSGGVSYGGQQIAPLAVVAGGTTTVAAPAAGFRRKPTWPSPSSPARARRCKAAR